MLAIFVIVPLLIGAAISAILKGYEKLISKIALAMSLVSMLFAFYLFALSPGNQNIPWFTLSGYIVHISTTLAPLHILLLLIVAIITPLVMLYSIGYMRLPSEQGRFYFELSIFSAAMMLFSIASNLITMFIGWELLGLTSYLLIGFWNRKENAMKASLKAISTILIGDILVLMGIVILWTAYGTFNIAYIAGAAHKGIAVEYALIFIIFGAFTKSAQFPFHEWLADAMEGPTPVSAFLHSSTMVKAGVFLIALILPLIMSYNLGYILIIIGVITALVGALNALSETHIKRILAYSTIEDMGLMFVALGFNSLFAAIALFFVQTFYKAELFMSAGYMMKANNDEENINSIYGPGRFKELMIPTIIAAASLAGIIPLSGFFGKAAVDSAVSNVYVYAMLVAIDLLSAAYIFRWMFIPLKKNGPRTSYERVPREMLIPIYILAIIIVGASVIYFMLPSYLGVAPISANYIHDAILLASAIIGIAVAYFGFYKSTATKSLNIIYTRRITNNFYALIVTLFTHIAGAVEKIDSALYGFIKDGSIGIRYIGSRLSLIENGKIDYYLIAFITGLTVIIVVFMVF